MSLFTLPSRHRCTPLLLACGVLVWASARLIWQGDHLGGSHGPLYGGLALDGVAGMREVNDLYSDIQVEPLNEAGWDSLEPPIIISKADYRYENIAKTGRTRWRYLTEEVRGQIREALRASPMRWRRLVLHASGSDSADASLLAEHQRLILPSSGALAYHFVLGNGTYSDAGAIEVGPRWLEQTAGSALNLQELNEDAISVCLVGQFDRAAVPSAQLAALEELITYLRARLGEIRVVTHEALESDVVTCPGRYVNDALVRQLNGVSSN